MSYSLYPAQKQDMFSLRCSIALHVVGVPVGAASIVTDP